MPKSEHDSLDQRVFKYLDAKRAFELAESELMAHALCAEVCSTSWDHTYACHARFQRLQELKESA